MMNARKHVAHEPDVEEELANAQQRNAWKMKKLMTNE